MVVLLYMYMIFGFCYKMWVILTGTSSALKKKKIGKESQYMVSHPELGSDPPIGSDRESGCDNICASRGNFLSNLLINCYDCITWS